MPTILQIETLQEKLLGACGATCSLFQGEQVAHFATCAVNN